MRADGCDAFSVYANAPKNQFQDSRFVLLVTAYGLCTGVYVCTTMCVHMYVCMYVCMCICVY
jgi:hypothetical protein